MTSLPVRPQPMIAVRDVEVSSRWYCHILGAKSGHGGPDYEQILVAGKMVMQLHRLEEGHHHGRIADPAKPLGNGVALWFETTDFTNTVHQIHESNTHVETDVHLNPNAGHREIWLRDPDTYLVVIAEP